jgi:hypothetical protein
VVADAPLLQSVRVSLIKGGVSRSELVVVDVATAEAQATSGEAEGKEDEVPVTFKIFRAPVAFFFYRVVGNRVKQQQALADWREELAGGGAQEGEDAGWANQEEEEVDNRAAAKPSMGEAELRAALLEVVEVHRSHCADPSYLDSLLLEEEGRAGCKLALETLCEELLEGPTLSREQFQTLKRLSGGAGVNAASFVDPLEAQVESADI